MIYIKILLIIIFITIYFNKFRLINFIKFRYHTASLKDDTYLSLLNSFEEYKDYNEILYIDFKSDIELFFKQTKYHKCKKLYNRVIITLNDLKMHLENDLNKETNFTLLIDTLDEYMLRYMRIIKNNNPKIEYTNPIKESNYYQELI